MFPAGATTTLRPWELMSWRKPGDPGLNQALKVLVGDFDQFCVRSPVERDLLVGGQSFCRKDLHSVEIAEGRHRAQFAPRESVPEFVLACKPDFARLRRLF